MLSQPTVIILGAGASMPYGFPSGRQLLREAQKYHSAESLADFIKAPVRSGVTGLYQALRHTIDQSIDAMLETLPADVVDTGKRFIARELLNRESALRGNTRPNDGHWHHVVWDALNLQSLEDFRASPITFITYNYERSLEYALYKGLMVKFPGKPFNQYREALDSIGPLHLHGQLGVLPELSNVTGGETVSFGGSGSSGPTESECVIASRAIRIVHEPNPMDSVFVRARAALAEAQRVIFLGFGYSRNNVERLQLKTCLKDTVQLFLCATGFTEAQQTHVIKPLFGRFNLMLGREDHDIVEFFRHHPYALL